MILECFYLLVAIIVSMIISCLGVIKQIQIKGVVLNQQMIYIGIFLVLKMTNILRIF